LRFTLAALAVPAGRDVKLAESRVEGYRNFATKIWNAARFCEMNQAELDPDFEPARVRLALNRWIIGKMVETAREVDAAFEGYRFNDAANGLYHFIWHSFCDWYLEFSKPILAGGEGAEETRATMAWVLSQLLHLLSPIMPFMTEELWQQMGAGGGRQLITSTWPEFDDALMDGAAADELEWVIRLITEIRSVRSELNVPAGSKVPLLVKGGGRQTQARIDAHREVLSRFASLASIAPTAEDAAKGEVPILLGDASFILPLADVIDIAQEQARVEKELGKLDKEITGLERKLANPQFLAKAPAEVVDKQKGRLESAKDSRASLAASLARLREL
jgi:valyl-tRNA synthetase